MDATNDALFQWLASRDAGLPNLAKKATGDDVEPFLETLLWDSAASFVNKPLRELKCGHSRANEFIQYFSYPLHSHFKAHKQPGKPWISQFPLFFRGGEDVQESLEVMARYATLYGGLQAHLTGFSFSGFANNESLKPMPRYMVLNLDEQANQRPPYIEFQKDESDVVVITARLPAEEAITLPHLDQIKDRYKTSKETFPLLDNDFEPANAKAFWEWFAKVTESEACKDSFNQVAKISERIAPMLVDSLTGNLSKNMQVTPDDARKLAEQLATFTTWNFLLGFKRIVYIPYRTLEPEESKLPSIRSWAGVILCLKDGVDLTREAIPFLTQSGLGEQNPDLHSDLATLDPLIAAVKLLVDVATSRASIGDWKYSQREFIHRQHAEAIRYGFEHEIRTLQAAVKLAVPTGVISEQISHELNASLALSKFVWSAFMEPAAMYSVAELAVELQACIAWPGFALAFEQSGESAPLEIPQPLLFVIAELCRNAEKYSTRTGSPQIKRATLSLFLNAQGGISARISNATNRADIFIVCHPGEPLNPEPSGQLGQFLVKRVVCNLLRGSFTFSIRNGQAEAVIALPPRQYA